MLSAERTPQETTWSLGEYMTGRQIWEAFQLAGRPAAGCRRVREPAVALCGESRALLGTVFAVRRSCCWPSWRRASSSAPRASASFQGGYVFQPGTAGIVLRHADLRDRQPRQQRRGRDDEPIVRNNWIYFELCAHQRRHGRRLRLRPRGQLLLRHRQRRRLDRRLAQDSRRAADAASRDGTTCGSSRRAKPASPPITYSVIVLARRAVAALLSDRARRPAGSADLRHAAVGARSRRGAGRRATSRTMTVTSDEVTNDGMAQLMSAPKTAEMGRSHTRCSGS